MHRILIFNGSPNGTKSNSARWVRLLEKELQGKASCQVVTLATKGVSSSLLKAMKEADGFIFVTGTYWDSWGSPLQKFFEDITEFEASPAFVGKPVSVFVLMHSVGGKAVLSRLQGVLSTFGFLIPPMSGMVYSLVSDIALKTKSSFAKDFWQKGDVALILQNFLTACDLKVTWASWPVDKKDPRRRWL